MSITQREPFSYILIVIGLLIFISCQGVHGKNSLDNHVFLSCETNGNIEKELSNGYRAFILLPGAPINDILDDAYDFLSINNEAILSLISKQQTAELTGILSEHKIREFLSTPEFYQLNELDDCIEANKRMFVFAMGNTPLCYSYDEFLCDYSVSQGFPLEVTSGFSGNRANDIVVFRMDSSINFLPDSLKAQTDKVPILFNTLTGKLPNFFVTNEPDFFHSFEKYFTKYNWYSTNVLYNNKPIFDVAWKEIPELISSGKIYIRQGKISPLKDGFRFSPDVFQFNDFTSDDTKIYYASPMLLSNKMELSLTFDESIDNQVGSVNASYCKIDYKRDETRDWCGLFNGENHFIDFDRGIELEDNITISVWVNPTKITGNNSIIGKGEAFSVKFREGRLLFTTPGIKDHLSDSIVVRKNEWQHLAFVFSANKGVRFFKNGSFIGEKESADFIPSNHSLLVGTNLWDEYFEGMMDDLIIWNRALSDTEISSVYQQAFEGDSNSKVISISLYSGMLLLISLLVIFIKRSIQRKTNTTQEPNIKSKHIPFIPRDINKSNQSTLKLFGGFHFVNRDNEDLTPRFSMRRKQIFILVLISTFRENGISSKQLTNKIWAGYSAESAKNNRSTQIQRLRDILSENSGIGIEFNNKKWIICFQDDVFCDLKQYFLLLNDIKESRADKLNIPQLEQLLSIIEKGAVLPQMDDEWLDEFKSNISDELLDLLVPLYRNRELISNHRLAVRLCDALLIFDPLNEIVLKHKINQLFLLEKKTLAHECFEHFSKNYQQCYNQPFATTFAELLNK